ncbi:MAG: tRNA (guanosine(46)-N7)-methyltransferase TrmB [Gallionellaceae bacterium]
MTDTTDLSKRHNKVAAEANASEADVKQSGRSHIRSFVLRQGRVSAAQQRALDHLLPRFGIPYSAHALDLAQVFGRDAPKILEIGFGMGETTAAIAQAHPQNDYLALEVHSPGVGSLLKQIGAMNLTNIRVIQHDAVEVLRDMIPDNSLDGVHIFFPDPWHKSRHNKRRLIQSPFLAQLVKKLKPGGYIHAATDWQDYAVQMLAVFSAEPLLLNTAADYAPRPEYRPLTKFEQRGLRLGHRVWDLVFKKR